MLGGLTPSLVVCLLSLEAPRGVGGVMVTGLSPTPSQGDAAG